MEYSVVVHKAEEGGFWVDVPALPGRYSQGATLEETLANAREATGLHIETLSDDGQPVPKDEDVVLKVNVAAQATKVF